MAETKKLSKVVFAKQMEMMNVYYTNFKFFNGETENEVQLRQTVWYETLQNLDDETFKGLVQSYCTNNIYPPQSPTHLIQHLKDMTLLGELSGDEAWETAYETVKKNHYAVDDACTYLTNNNKIAIANSLKEMKSRFRNLMTDDIPYVRKDFIEIYKRVVAQVVNQKVLLGDTSTLKIGSGGK